MQNYTHKLFCAFQSWLVTFGMLVLLDLSAVYTETTESSVVLAAMQCHAIMAQVAHMKCPVLKSGA